MTDTLSQYSVLALYSAMAIYAIAFVLFTLDLAKGASTDSAPMGEASRVVVVPERRKLARIAMALTVIGWLLQLAATIMRGLAASRVPWANMYEFAISAAFLILLVYLTSLKIKDLRFVATFVVAFSLVTLFASVSLFYVEVKTIMPALQSYWLVIHVVVAVLATAFFTLRQRYTLAI